MKIITNTRGEFNVPVAFMTNGGGCLESEKAAQLSDWLGVKVHKDMICLSHSPMHALSEKYRNKTVLLVGVPNRGTDFEKAYGFDRMITLEEYVDMFPALDPFQHKYPKEPHNDLPQIDAVMVFYDPRTLENWYQAAQVIIDLMRSNGRPGHFSHGGKQILPLYFSNPDFLWAADFAWPRFGQGAFKMTVDHLYKNLTGHDLKYTTYGKPLRPTYEFTEKLLSVQAKKLGLGPVVKIYGIGDNPAADIRGANNAGDLWESVLVRTGVFSGGENDFHDPADHVVQDVFEAMERFAK